MQAAEGITSLFSVSHATQISYATAGRAAELPGIRALTRRQEGECAALLLQQEVVLQVLPVGKLPEAVLLP